MIEVCAKFGARTLVYGDLRVEFGPETGTLANFHHTEPSPDVNTPSATKEFTLADKDLLEEIRREQLMLDSPLDYENEVIEQHLRQGAMNEAFEDRRA